MTALLRTDFNDFLFAPIADDANGTRLTMLSALARQGVDPWAEAADLAGLSRESATQKVVSFLERVPNGPSPGVDTATLASGLVALLHRSAKRPHSAAPATPPDVAEATRRKHMSPAIYFLLVLICLLIAFG